MDTEKVQFRVRVKGIIDFPVLRGNNILHGPTEGFQYWIHLSCFLVVVVDSIHMYHTVSLLN